MSMWKLFSLPFLNYTSTHRECLYVGIKHRLCAPGCVVAYLKRDGSVGCCRDCRDVAQDRAETGEHAKCVGQIAALVDTTE
jgi:hypothetical protein